MTSTVKIIVVLLVLAGAGVGLRLVTSRAHEDPVSGPDVRTATRPGNVPVPPPAPRALASGDQLPQGFRGRVVDPHGKPVAGAEVYLQEGNSWKTMQLAQKGLVMPPIAGTRTDPQGTFHVGLELTDSPMTCALAVVSSQWMLRKVTNLRVFPDEWYDLGAITLEQGGRLQGRVLIAGGNGLPVPGAVVTIQEAGPGPEVSPIPGHEHGIPIPVDSHGFYLVENAPLGVVDVAAVAPGFTRVEHQGFEVARGEPGQLDFELTRGRTLTGIVTDSTGAPVGDVRITAVALSSKTPLAGKTRSGSDGRFEVSGLLEGPHRLEANAAGFVEQVQKPVHAGEAAVRVVLERKGCARLLVHGQDDCVLTSYVVTPRVYFEGQCYGNSEVPPLTAQPDNDGVTTVPGLDPGARFVFQVEAPGYAKAYSEPFQVVTGAEPPRVIVRMDEGGVIEGSVRGPDGQPLPGVTVSTLPNEFDETTFTDRFQDVMPILITRTQTQTTANGRFRIPRLNRGPYQLKFAHPDYFEVFLTDQSVATGVTTEVPTVTLRPGTVLTGQVSVNGKPGGQVMVTIETSDAAPPEPGTSSPPRFACEARTHGDGRFRLPKRVPPGRYRVVAMRCYVENPLLPLLDPMHTRQEIELRPEQASHHLRIRIVDPR